MVCERCGFESPAGLRFCGSCGAALLAAEEPRREQERKIVSALFCDLAGSTQRAALLDPEDVHRRLGPYYATTRRELERLRGTVEKFIGDGVFALFGAPRAHGDDAERAVRAALAVRNAIAELDESDPALDLHVRIGVTTGEAVVDVGARPREGEGMAWGDVLNIASRLQAAAPVDGILVDEATYRATRHVIAYGVAEPIEARGKAEPILVWQALEARARRGIDPSRAAREPLVGRADELATLLEMLDRVARRSIPELLTLVGEPGIGKSRLIFELARQIHLSPALITWRQGRSSPYGDGSTFGALGEVVKGQAGILETDGAATAADKLRRAVTDLVAEPADAARIEAHLHSLVGLGEAVAAPAEQRDAAFEAWRHFLEALARQRPLVLVFEDVHWADDGLLDFIEHLRDWARDAPLLIVCTARPELSDRRPGWGDSEKATTIELAPLAGEETARLVAEVSAGAVPREMARRIVRAASGNPLYAVEFIRMLEDRGLLRSPGADAGRWSGHALPVPESIQGLIAARLDSLPSEDKALVHDAAVVGSVVWPGALAAVGDRSRRSAERDLRELEGKGFLIRARPSSVEREPEYSFRHVLVRDVAYAQVPRSRRGEAHRRTAEWLESLSPDRVTDRVEMLAHHYLSAHALAQATGADTAELTERARLALRDAGDRALSLHSFPAAARYFRSALELWPEQDPDRPWLLFRLGRSLYYADTGGADVLLEAENGLLAAGDRETAAKAETFLMAIAHQQGEPQERVFEHAYRATALVEGLGPSPSTVEVLVDLANVLGLAAEHERAIGVAREALGAAETLGLRELQARALSIIGISRGMSGDSGGRADLERSIAIMEEIDSYLLAHCCGMLADLEYNLGNLDRCFPLQEKARRQAERFGHAAHIQWLKAERVAEDYWTGRWHDALRGADSFIAQTEAGSPRFMEAYCRAMRGRIRLARGELAEALDDADRALRQARGSNEPQMLYPALAFSARALAASGALEEAAQISDELLGAWTSAQNLFPPSAWVVDLVCALEPLHRADELLRAVDGVAGTTAWLDASTAYARGEFPTAAVVFARIGSRPDEALARLRTAESLLGSGRDDDARSELELSLAFFRAVEANAYLGRAEALAVGLRSYL